MSRNVKKGTRRKPVAKGSKGIQKASGLKKVHPSSICTCCIAPMQKALSQIVGQQVTLVTEADQPNRELLFQTATIQTVDNYLVSMVNESLTHVVSICDVVAVLFNTGPMMALAQPQASKGECLCKERPFREQFNTLINMPIDVTFKNGLVLKSGIVLRTGEGTIYLQSSDATQSCVASIEKMSYFTEAKEKKGSIVLS